MFYPNKQGLDFSDVVYRWRLFYNTYWRKRRRGGEKRRREREEGGRRMMEGGWKEAR